MLLMIGSLANLILKNFCDGKKNLGYRERRWSRKKMYINLGTMEKNKSKARHRECDIGMEKNKEHGIDKGG